MNACTLLLKSHFRLLGRNLNPFITAVIIPSVLILFGQLFDQAIPMLPAALMMLFLHNCTTEISNDFLNGRSKGLYAFVHTSPTSISELTFVYYIRLTVLMIASGIIMLITAHYMGLQLNMGPTQYVEYVVLIVYMTALFAVIGVFLGSVIQKPSRVHLINELLNYVFPALAGGFFLPSKDSLPAIRSFLYANPYTFLSEVLQHIFRGEPLIWSQYLYGLLGTAIVSLVLLMVVKRAFKVDIKYYV